MAGRSPGLQVLPTSIHHAPTMVTFGHPVGTGPGLRRDRMGRTRLPHQEMLVHKAGAPGWAVIVPFYNGYVLLRICGRPGWWLLLLIVPVVNIVVFAVVAVDVARSFGRSDAFAIFGLFLFAPVGYLILGFGADRNFGPAALRRPQFQQYAPPYPRAQFQYQPPQQPWHQHPPMGQSMRRSG
ncbi:DUF5684 domain-containing protein [Allokutzneria oryzae]|uniref:DUF5684 domain-containing protein n=1 Tax=Allokutzneria oryzae TaxID=1378989 RepID=A0ABV6A1P7_9PSEU